MSLLLRVSSLWGTFAGRFNQSVRESRDVPRSDRDEYATGAKQPFDCPLGCFEIRGPPGSGRTLPVRSRPQDIKAAHPFKRTDRLLASRVNIEYHHFISECECGAECRTEGLGPGVEVGLEHSNEAIGLESAKGGKRSLYLRRVVRVVVVYAGTA